MTVLQVPQDAMDSAPEWMGGDFPIPPEGAAIPFEICGSKEDENEVGTIDRAIYKSGDREGEEYTYLVIDMLWAKEDGETERHGEFFDLDADWGLGKLKAYIESLGFQYEEGMDLNALNGLRLTADVGHVESRKGRMMANLKYGTFEVQEAPQAAPAKPRRPARSAR